jgi:hypothetical protein
MKDPIPNPSRSRAHAAPEHWFYFTASLALLVLAFIGFRLFYLQGKAYPGRELTPPIRPLLIVHGVLMAAWMLLAVAQPLLVAAGRRRVHMALGKIGAGLAAGIVVVGVQVAIGAARVNPPDHRLYGLAPKEFVMVPLASILAFGALVLVGVWNRRRPEVHRPMMLLASLVIISAAVGRMPLLNGWYAGTWLERLFSAFPVMLAIGAALLAGKWLVTRSFDRWLAAGFAALAAMSLVASLTARTAAWTHFTTALCGETPAAAAREISLNQ